jgi:AraC-like DNA-binding protein
VSDSPCPAEYINLGLLPDAEAGAGTRPASRLHDIMGRAGSASPVAARVLLERQAPRLLVRERLSAGSSSGRPVPGILAFQQSQHLLKRRLARPLLATFSELTGLHLHAAWHPYTADAQTGPVPGPCSTARQGSAGKLPKRCEACLRKHRPRALYHSRRATRFTGLCGAMNYCASVNVLDRPSVTLSVQQAAPASRRRKQAFVRAVHLMRLVTHDLEATLDAEGGHGGHTGRKEDPPAAAVAPQPGSAHARQIVQRMLDFIHEHYARPIQLADLAADVRLTPSYVSTLFSTTLGVGFQHCLEQFRLAKAKDLLCDPTRRVSEVAYAVGYLNPNHFRNVFTARVGLPPSAWRERLPAPGCAA